jgi:arylsulfatase A-like enzyme
MYEHTIGVPLILSGPGIPAGRLFDSQCYLRDLFSTLCDLVKIESPGNKIDSRSLKPVLDGVTKQIHPFIVGYFRNFQRMIRTDEWKYIEYPAVNQQQLFHLSADPFETQSLADTPDHAQILEQLQKQMRDWFRDKGDAVYVTAEDVSK